VRNARRRAQALKRGRRGREGEEGARRGE